MDRLGIRFGAAAALAWCVGAFAQPASLPAIGYAEPFDAMTEIGTAPPVGWSVWNIPGSSGSFTSSIAATSISGAAQVTPPGALGIFTQTATAAGASNNLGYNVAMAATPTDRALGTSPSGIAGCVLQLWLRNDTGSSLTGLTVGYTCRVMSEHIAAELPGYSVFVSTDPLSPFVSVPALDAAPTAADSTGAALMRSATFALPSNLSPGEGLWLRWVDDNAQVTSPDQMFAMDDVRVEPASVVSGACCLSAVSACVLAGGPGDCAGEFRGLGVACEPNPCAPPAGSCCHGDGRCIVVPESACATGDWAAGGACTPLACPRSGAVRLGVIGDYGVDNAFEAAVAERIKKFHPQVIATVGDNTYFTNADFTNWDRTQAKYYGEFIKRPAGGSFFPQGSPRNRFFPVMGNHDWDVGGTSASFTAYFDLPGNERYYTIKLGPAQLFMLSSDSREPDSNATGGAQHAWLLSNLAQCTARWKLVFFHHPARTSTTGHAPSATMQGWAFESLGLTAVLQGHNHHSERIESGGIPWFVCGAGGQSLYSLASADPDSVFLNTTSHAFMIIDADDARISFRFIDAAGALLDTRIIESTGACCTGAVCTIAAPAACELTGGIPMGADTACVQAVTCCAANFNRDAALGVQDLFDFLAAFFGGCP